MWNQIAPPRTWDRNRSTWMTQLADEIAIQDLSIPGTHDSACLVGFESTSYSETQQWKIEDQLKNGIRFLDLRVKIMYRGRGLAMYHGSDMIYDPDHPSTYDQLYYKAVIGKCVQFLRQNPKEVLVVSVKCEGDTEWDGWSVEDWFRQIANEVAFDNSGTWDMWWDDRSNVNATLGSVRGKMLLWRRFPRGGRDKTLNYSDPFGLDLTPLNNKYDNTRADNWYTPVGGYTWVQDNYSGVSVEDKFEEWCKTMNAAYDTRCVAGNTDWNRQFIDFTSVGATATWKPRDFATPIVAAVAAWLRAVHSGLDESGQDLGGQRYRSGIGVVPMDYPNLSTIDLMINANFAWTHRIGATQKGKDHMAAIKAVLKSGAYPAYPGAMAAQP